MVEDDEDVLVLYVKKGE